MSKPTKLPVRLHDNLMVAVYQRDADDKRADLARWLRKARRAVARPFIVQSDVAESLCFDILRTLDPEGYRKAKR